LKKIQIVEKMHLSKWSLHMTAGARGKRLIPFLFKGNVSLRTE
jgi:hypothetical protein